MTVRFATLGPAATNHALVTRRYLAFHGLADASLALVDDFPAAVRMLLDGAVDRVVQCAAHPAFAATIGSHLGKLFAVDCFIAPSRELAVLVRKGVERPGSIGLQPATRDYVDIARWGTPVPEPTIVAVAEGLLASRYDAGIAAADLALERPDRVEIAERIGSVDDVWVVYGTQRACAGELLAWQQSPGAPRRA